MSTPLPGGTITLADDLTITRMGYGAMQFGLPGTVATPDAAGDAGNVLRHVVELGINHIDTSDFYGAGGVNQLIRAALRPYPDDLHIATKVGFRSDREGNWSPAPDPDDLRRQVRENLDSLGLDALDLVNLRVDTPTLESVTDDSIAEQFTALAKLRDEGLIRHLGLSCVSEKQLTEAQSIAPVVSVQNYYNLAQRDHDDLVDRCEADNIAFVPFFPLGGFSPLQSQTLTDVAARVGASPQQVALAWLLQRSTTIALIPGTSSIAHLRDNIAAAALTLPAEAIAELNTIGAAG
ncbi:oxidoreductase [Nocardia sp. NPDC058705]|uniref:oxidoreductase n=1 Tax=Nocardia sp. NPDC058705 TaxID=3346609 RepID=UPI0036826EE3